MKTPYVIVMLIDLSDYASVSMLTRYISGFHSYDVSGMTVSINHINEAEYDALLDYMEDNNIDYRLDRVVWMHDDNVVMV